MKMVIHFVMRFFCMVSATASCLVFMATSSIASLGYNAPTIVKRLVLYLHHMRYMYVYSVSQKKLDTQLLVATFSVVN